MSRLDVKKTYKLSIGGEFPRSESGRTMPAFGPDGTVLAHVARASRKDLRDAVRAARDAFPGWAGRTGYNRGQILYRVAEMVEDRSAVFVARLRAAGTPRRRAEREVGAAVDRLVWYAGWCDKFVQVYGNLNPVAGPFFNVSTPEPTGVVGIVAPTEPGLLGLVSRLAPVLVPGNTAVVLASPAHPLVAITFAEALATADLPGGVVNILTGEAAELVPWLAGHMDVNALDLGGVDPTGPAAGLVAAAEESSADNTKRVVRGADPVGASPFLIAAFTETKTVWHPKGR